MQRNGFTGHTERHASRWETRCIVDGHHKRVGARENKSVVIPSDKLTEPFGARYRANEYEEGRRWLVLNSFPAPLNPLQ